MARRYLMNSPVLAAFGEYRYREMSIEDARTFVAERGWTSAIGHDGTARAMEALLGLPVPHERREVTLDVDDAALIFSVRGRLAEGQILTADEVLQREPQFGLLERVG